MEWSLLYGYIGLGAYWNSHIGLGAYWNSLIENLYIIKPLPDINNRMTCMLGKDLDQPEQQPLLSTQ